MAINSFKVMSIKFLMNMFESLCETEEGIKRFKNTVDNMIQQGQIDNSIKQIVCEMYGVKNSDTFYKARVKNKIVQIKFLMNTFEAMDTVSGGKDKFMNMLTYSVKDGSISQSAKDSICKIYNLKNDIAESRQSNTTIKKEKTTVNSGLENRKQEIDKDVDIQFIDIAYYKYISGDACRESTHYMKVTDASFRPVNSKVVYKVGDGDGCGHGIQYSETPPNKENKIKEENKTRDTSRANDMCGMMARGKNPC